MPRHAQRDEATALAALHGIPAAADRYGLTYGELYRWCRADGVKPARSYRRRPPKRLNQSASLTPGRHLDGTMDAACWCDRRIVRVAPADVRAGVTRSCGLAGCAPEALAS